MNLRRDVFQAIADPTRRAILLLLISQTMTPNDLAERFDSTRQTISKHIQILTECELLNKEKNGREIHYSLNPVKIKEIEDFIEPFRHMWEERFDRLDQVVEKLKKQSKSK